MVKQYKQEQGYIMISMLILVGLALALTASTLTTTSNAAKAAAVVNIHNDRFYDVERYLGKVAAWMQDNSEYFVTAFTGATCTTNFTTGNPSLGANEASYFGVPTTVKVAGTSNSAMLSNNTNFGTSAFPNLTHVSNGSSFNPVTSFASTFPNSDNSGVNLRAILLAVRSSGGNCSPMFRIDAITGNNPDRGVHMFSYMYGTFLDNTAGSGSLFGNGSVNFAGNGVCQSRLFTWNGSAWAMGADTNNCRIHSAGSIAVGGSGQINGRAQSNTAGGVTGESSITNNNANGCEATGCHTTTLIGAPAWPGTCTPGTNVTVAANTTTSLSAGCYGTVTVNNKGTLSLNDTSATYYFTTLTMSGGQNQIQTTLANSTCSNLVNVVIQSITGNSINAQQMLNNVAAPAQFRVTYIGAAGLRLNGGGYSRMDFRAPNAALELNGNFDFYGKVNAASISVLGTTDIITDDTTCLGVSATNDINFSINKTEARLR